MNNLTLIKKLQQISYPKQRSQDAEAGFSLIELIVVVLIIAVLSAIAAPGWLAFVNRQRVAKVNDAIFTNLQEAQREAKRTNRGYNVSFKADSLEVAVYREDTPSGAIRWEPLSQDLDIKDKQVILCSNVGDDNTKGSAICDFSGEKTIAFDYQGNLDSNEIDGPDIGDEDDEGIGMTVAIPQTNNNSQPIEATARCVVVKTIIGSMVLEQGEDCPQ